MIATIKQIKPISQFDIIKTPSEVATPLPPLNPKNTGKVWPITTDIPANWTSNALLSILNIYAINNAILIAITPFKMSHTSVMAAAFFPTERSIFVVPAFPLPFSLTSNPAIFLLNITEKFILPIKYEITAVIIHIKTIL